MNPKKPNISFLQETVEPKEIKEHPFPAETNEQPSDEQIIAFIIKHIKNQRILHSYFLSLTKPLSPAVLTLKISPMHDPRLRTVLNFLSYSALIRRGKCLKRLVELATVEAIDEALFEAPICENGISALNAALHQQTRYKKQGVLELIQKASSEVINALLITQFSGSYPLTAAISFADPEVTHALIAKARPEVIDTLVSNLYMGHTLLDYAIERLIKQKIPASYIETLLEKLKPVTIDFIMLHPLAPGLGLTPLTSLLLDLRHGNKEAKEALIGSLVVHTSPKTLNEIAKIKITVLHALAQNFLSLLMMEKASPKIIDLILSQLNKELVNSLAFNAEIGISPLFLECASSSSFFGLPPKNLMQATDPSLETIIKYLDPDTLTSLIKHPVNSNGLQQLGINAASMDEFKEEYKPLTFQNGHLYTLAEKPTLLNRSIKNMLLQAHPISLTNRILYSLDEDNLRLYLAQHPELALEKLKQVQGYFFAFNWMYQESFLKRLEKAHTVLHSDIKQLLRHYASLYNSLKILQSAMLIELVLDFLKWNLADLAALNVESPAMIYRMDYELLKEKTPETVFKEKMLTLADAYSEIKPFFHHLPQFNFNYAIPDEAALILHYAADNPLMVNEAIEEVTSRPKAAKPNNTKAIPFFDMGNTKSSWRSAFSSVVSFFDKPTPPSGISKFLKAFQQLESAKKEISDFEAREHSVLEENIEDLSNQRTPKTLEGLKIFYQRKGNSILLAQIAKLEQNLNLANTHFTEASTEIIHLIFKNFGNTTQKKPKAAHAQLFNAAQRFGFDCHDMHRDGNCFFHAVAHQLALAGFAHLGSSDAELRAKAMHEMLTNINTYSGFFDKDANTYIEENLESGVWADQPIIAAMSRALNINIVIIRSDGAPPNILMQHFPQTTIYLGYEVGLHYQSLIENNALLRERSLLQPYIDQARRALFQAISVVAPVTSNFLTSTSSTSSSSTSGTSLPTVSAPTTASSPIPSNDDEEEAERSITLHTSL